MAINLMWSHFYLRVQHFFTSSNNFDGLNFNNDRNCIFNPPHLLYEKNGCFVNYKFNIMSVKSLTYFWSLTVQNQFYS